jgi:hypothetical protein
MELNFAVAPSHVSSTADEIPDIAAKMANIKNMCILFNLAVISFHIDK